MQRQSFRTASPTLLAAALALAALLIVAGKSPAESGFIDSLPVTMPPGFAMNAAQGPAAPSATNLRLTVNSRWPGDYGYRPVRFRFEAATPSAADRSITVRYTENGLRSKSNRLSVEQDTELPAGASVVELSMSVPQYAKSKMISWTVWVDGVMDASLSRAIDESLQHNPSRRPGLSMLAPFILEARGDNQVARAVRRRDTSPTPLLRNLIPHELPESWLDLSGVEVVLTSIDQLRALEQQPERLEVLRQWVTLGGDLWVEDVGRDFGDLPRISSLVALTQGPSMRGGDRGEGPLEDAPEWRWTRLRDSESFRQRQGPVDASEAPEDEKGLLSEGLFAEARLGFGRVIAFKSSADDVFHSTTPDRSRGATRVASAIADHLGKANWSYRHGLSPDAANTDFSNLLPPEAGRAPVTLFQVLITLFVLVAGPLNFWLLARRQRLHLMVLSIPLTALALTSGLLLYAVLAEGFGVKLRARSVTLLDQTRGELSSWSRLSYYAGSPPSEGLVFPASTAVYPVLPGWNEPAMSGSLKTERTIDWRPDAQVLRSGWLPSREVTQLLTLQAHSSGANIGFDLTAGALTASNNLGAEAVLLIVRDAQGAWWVTEGLADDVSRELEPVEFLDALSKLRIQVSDAEPTLPPGLESLDQSTLISNDRRRRRKEFRRSYGIDYATTSLGDNLMNEMLDRLIGLEGSDPLALPERSYVALTSATDWLALGVDDAEETGSFHVVIGRW